MMESLFIMILDPPDRNMFMRYNTTFIVKYPYSGVTISELTLKIIYRP